MSSGHTESVVEQAVLAWIESAGWRVRNGTGIAPGEPVARRDAYGQVGHGPAAARVVVAARLRRSAAHGGCEAYREDPVMVQAPSGEVLLYEAPDGGVRVEVKLERDTVWLTQQQMADLFGRERSVVTKHIRNTFQEGELDPAATCAKFAQVRTEGTRTVSREVDHFNLDVVISVGYRVKSLRGTQFRLWATRTLREHLVRGYTLNRERFEHNARELEAALALVRKAAAGEALSTDQGCGLVDVIARYTQTFLLLQRYDEGLLVEPRGIVGGLLPPAPEARAAIVRLKRDLLARGEATELFGREPAEGLAALELLVAESAPTDKEVMIRLVMNMLAELVT